MVLPETKIPVPVRKVWDLVQSLDQDLILNRLQALANFRFYDGNICDISIKKIVSTHLDLLLKMYRYRTPQFQKGVNGTFSKTSTENVPDTD